MRKFFTRSLINGPTARLGCHLHSRASSGMAADLSLPAASIMKIVKGKLPTISVSKEGKTALARAASIFILYVTSAYVAGRWEQGPGDPISTLPNSLRGALAFLISNCFASTQSYRDDLQGW